MTPFQRITILRARYHVEWLLLLNGNTHGLDGWINLIEALNTDSVARFAAEWEEGWKCSS